MAANCAQQALTLGHEGGEEAWLLGLALGLALAAGGANSRGRRRSLGSPNNAAASCLLRWGRWWWLVAWCQELQRVLLVLVC
jgi:hypothetical protein